MSVCNTMPARLPSFNPKCKLKCQKFYIKSLTFHINSLSTGFIDNKYPLFS